MLTGLSYASRALVGAHSVEMLEIVRVSLRDNPKVAITGALYFDDAHFFQYIEGPAVAIDALYARIQHDRRHHDVTLLSRGPAAARLFDGWSMRFHDGSAAFDRRCFDLERLRAADPAGLSDAIARLQAL